MSKRERLIYAGAGLSVWLNGAVGFRLGGKTLFEHGAVVVVVVALVIAAAVCLAFHATMAWRKADPSNAVEIAVMMALPGLFGEALRQAAFEWATELQVRDAPAFAAVIFFGNGVLLVYALLRQATAAASTL